MTKTCPNCGKENPDNSSFCKNCGTDLKSVSSAPASKGGPVGWWSEQTNLVKALSIIGICCVGLLVIVGISAILSPDSNTSTTTSTPTSTQTATPVQTEPTWHSVATFTGTGDKETDSFTIKGQKFKVKITATTESLQYGSISFFTYPEGETRSYAGYGAIDSFSQSTETDEFMVTASPGSYYLSVLAANMKNWKAEVFDYY